MTAIAIVCGGHLSTCPRMVKAADALAEAGYRVRVVSTQFTDWAAAADADLLKRRGGAWISAVIDYRRGAAIRRYLYSGVRQRAAGAAASLFSPSRSPMWLNARARGRVHSELVKEATASSCDFVYGGANALAPAAEAAREIGVRFALDLEDFHSAEEELTSSRTRLSSRLHEQIEHELLSQAAFVTAGSAAIARAYEKKYAVPVATIDNVFPLPAAAPSMNTEAAGPLRLYWFSQTIGAGRGLEDAVKAVGIAEIPCELHLRGIPAAGYLDFLLGLAESVSPTLRIQHHAPGKPDDMVSLAEGYDIGLALELEHPYNRAICLTNKVFVYMLAGLALAITTTEGQQPVVDDVASSLSFPPGGIATFARGLKQWYADRASLKVAKAASWNAASRRWHWEHQSERGRLLQLFASTVDRRT